MPTKKAPAKKRKASAKKKITYVIVQCQEKYDAEDTRDFVENDLGIPSITVQVSEDGALHQLFQHEIGE